MVNLMEWQKHQQQQHSNEQNQNQSQTANINGGMMYVKVMTDEQLETLRKQIAIYASICEQLVDMHKQLTAQQDLAGVRLGNIYCDPFMASAGHKITSRQRWTPTPGQLKILEEIFENGIGTPTKQKIKEITAQLIHHGQISETNVYNWFQNRRARSKRKQQNLAPSNAESEIETEVESSKDKKTKPEEFQSQHSGTTRPEEMCHQSLDACSDIHYVNPQSNKPDSVFSSHGNLKSTRSFGQMSDFDGVLSNSRIGVPGNYNLYQQAGDYNMTD